MRNLQQDEEDLDFGNLLGLRDKYDNEGNLKPLSFGPDPFSEKTKSQIVYAGDFQGSLVVDCKGMGDFISHYSLRNSY